MSGRICSAPELALDEDQTIPNPYKRMTKLEIAEALLPRMSETEGSKIRYTEIPPHLYDSSSAAAEITKENLDWRQKLEVVIQLGGGELNFHDA